VRCSGARRKMARHGLRTGAAIALPAMPRTSYVAAIDLATKEGMENVQHAVRGGSVGGGDHGRHGTSGSSDLPRPRCHNCGAGGAGGHRRLHRAAIVGRSHQGARRAGLGGEQERRQRQPRQHCGRARRPRRLHSFACLFGVPGHQSGALCEPRLGSAEKLRTGGARDRGAARGADPQEPAGTHAWRVCGLCQAGARQDQLCLLRPRLDPEHRGRAAQPIERHQDGPPCPIAAPAPP
jgi:hypothetical protein